MKERKKLLQKRETKSLYYEFSKRRSFKRSLYLKWDLFLCRKLVKRWSFLSIYETCMIFWERREIIFKSSKKKTTIRWYFLQHEILCLLIALVLNFSKMGNTVFFISKKLMEIWYLLSIFKLSMILQDLGNMVFGTVVGLFRGAVQL